MMFLNTNSMLISSAKSDQCSQAEYLILAQRIAHCHKLLVLIVVFGIACAPFAPFNFLLFYTIFFSGVAIVPIFNKGKCPLTLWEKKCISKGGQEPYQNSFIPQYFPFVTPFWVHIGKVVIALTLIGVWIFK